MVPEVSSIALVVSLLALPLDDAWEITRCIVRDNSRNFCPHVMRMVSSISARPRPQDNGNISLKHSTEDIFLAASLYRNECQSQARCLRRKQQNSIQCLRRIFVLVTDQDVPGTRLLSHLLKLLPPLLPPFTESVV
jgi:hypothetical protein